VRSAGEVVHDGVRAQLVPHAPDRGHAVAERTELLAQAASMGIDAHTQDLRLLTPEAARLGGQSS
jgi:hypothetical protein